MSAREVHEDVYAWMSPFVAFEELAQIPGSTTLAAPIELVCSSPSWSRWISFWFLDELPTLAQVLPIRTLSSSSDV
jgi:hypothetical protein